MGSGKKRKSGSGKSGPVSKKTSKIAEQSAADSLRWARTDVQSWREMRLNAEGRGAALTATTPDGDTLKTENMASANTARMSLAAQGGKPDKAPSNSLSTETDMAKIKDKDRKKKTKKKKNAPLNDQPAPPTKASNVALQSAEKLPESQPAKPATPATALKKAGPPERNRVIPQLAIQASRILTIAAAIGALMILAALAIEGGREAVAAIGGVLNTTVAKPLAGIVLALDLLFPIFYGAGLAVLATSLQTRGNRPIVRMALTALLVAVSADFAENALVFDVMQGGVPNPFQWVATLVKYGSIAVAGVLVSAILPVRGGMGVLSHLLIRYAFPVAIALLVAGTLPMPFRDAIATGFPIALLVLAIYTAILAEQK